MTRSDAIQCYCRQVEHWIDLPKKRRRELLSGLRRELEDAYPPAEALTVAVIHRETGSPCETAGSLARGVPWEERERYRLRRKRLYICIIAVLAAVSLLTSAYALYMRATGGTAIIETIVYTNDPPPEPPEDGESRIQYHYN
ncbi:MAG: hypothetical protein HFF64_08060 [Oscillospiraceae bacterium]|nr:hypothetical protein [Oscillospiraceae bacterium]